MDVVAAILLAISTVATAWCAYQSTRWSGVQATSFAEASSLRIQAGSQSNVALATVDTNTSTIVEWINEWINARSAGDPALLSYGLDNLIGSKFNPYLDTRNESQPGAGSSSAPGEQSTPTGNADSGKEPAALSTELERRAQLKFLQATNANQTGDDYMLATVLFASVLSFAGVSTKFKRFRIQGSLVAAGLMMLALGVIQIAELPIH